MRGEGNHKIPGSFAPENMEKTGAERVKYSLACQHEDAIPIKFVSYAQKCPTVLCTFAVALRKESVDRNAMNPKKNTVAVTSLSARRAWIEIDCRKGQADCSTVALRKESVDRNRCSPVSAFTSSCVALRKESVDRNSRSFFMKETSGLSSLSARRAWIEILCLRLMFWLFRVALRKESVDRNPFRLTIKNRPSGRSPQGERG